MVSAAAPLPVARHAVNGFGLIEKPVDAIFQQLQILARHRRDLVKKRAKLQCQIRHHLELALPGFGALFDGDDLWTQTTPVPLLEAIAQRGGTVDVVKQAGQKGITHWLEVAEVRFHKKTVERVTVWAANAAQSDPMAAFHTRVWMSQLADWKQKTLQIQDIERDSAGLPVDSGQEVSHYSSQNWSGRVVAEWNLGGGQREPGEGFEGLC